jgi:hypothetical protein
MKKVYKITFYAELTEDDVKAMQGCFYQAMNESMDIYSLYGLKLEDTGAMIPEDDDDDTPDIEDVKKYTMHIDDIVDGLYACKTINEVRDFLDTIPRKFGEWWVDEVDGYYEVTNEWWDEQYGELNSRTYDLEIEVEEEDE